MTHQTAATSRPIEPAHRGDEFEPETDIEVAAEVAAAPLWPAGSATGIGSLPGTDIGEAVRLALGELPQLPYLPELPGRGPGADMIGRSAGLLVEMAVELYAGEWRIADRPGRDLRVALDLMERDLDQLTEQADGWKGSLKVQTAGPWTLAATLNRSLGGRMLADHGAVRDLTESLAEGLRLHVADLRRRLPGARLLVQLDEPALPAVLAGQVPTESGLYTYRSPDAAVARDRLRAVVDAAGVPVIFHCCAGTPPISLFREAGAAALALDVTTFTRRPAMLDQLGEALDAGTGLLAGLAPTLPPAGGRPPTAAGLADEARRLWSTLGFADHLLQRQLVVTPTCGLAGATPAYARAVLAACQGAALRLTEA
jgi:hypothetical protein